MTKQTIGVFMGAQFGHLEAFHEAAAAMGKGIADHDWALVYGGSKGGLMGEVAEHAINAGAHVTGIRPTSLLPEEASDNMKMEHIDVPDMDTRKRMMFDRADAFVFLPGGMGTLEELGQVMSWTKLGYYEKPIVLVNVDGYWDDMVAWFETAIEAEFVTREGLSRLALIPTVDETFKYLEGEFGE
ncbi:LOG family protein [Weissella confusa]|uniref:LOG family protein n=1 Tax=Weissella confusa TaxID=1583 RepID=UPI00107F8BF2|nr:TIGR00730 family Rossman fold protein [Weissella confusa]MBD1490506.1 TIGR00730 family Rossman fold protein [Weissella confusa]MBJ7621435.1 TIGR00730 family Rossman fold protein [Weissella confusa]MBJ7630180.1 TIGR00730 family Rossman fold protein [Weissella confusa]MBJ7635021.1 TIGR00730 family Rossman fold protein [Weissella confusa]MBJ7641286.1 TIGR00730 family Rossman fold protein [Weissella confusa]